MSNHRTIFRPHGCACRLGLLASLLCLVASVSAQQPTLGVLRNFSWPDYYPPPNETQLRFLLKGAEAVPQSGGLIIVRQVTLEKFRETGTQDMLIETPECAFNTGSREVSSARTLKMQFEGGRLTLEGEGFSWQQTNSLLVVSNNVVTTFQGTSSDAERVAPPALLTLGDARITSDRFNFDGKASLAAYRGHVRIASSNLVLTAEALTFKLPASSTGTVQSLTAETDVRIELGELRAAGDRAVYSPGDGLVELGGSATWQAQGREGRGRILRLNNARRAFQVEGQASMKLPLTGAGLFSQEPNTGGATAVADHFIVIQSDRYEILTNAATFVDGVRAVEQGSGQSMASLQCGTLSLTLGVSNQVQSLVAEEGVVFEEGERQLSAQRATFDGAGAVLQLTGQPAWRDGERHGRAQTLSVDLRDNYIVARGDASVALPRPPGGALMGALAMGPDGKSRPAIAEGASTDSGTTQIFSDEYEFTPESVAFRGHVRVDDAQIQLTSDALTAALGPGGTNVARVVLDQNVVMSLVETNGQTTRMTCEQAVYTGTNDLLELTGQPVVQQSSAASTNTFMAERILLNRTTGQVSARGRLRGRLILPPSRATNAPAFPFGKFK